jgi:hypothetical protein
MAANELSTARWFEASGDEIYEAFQNPECLARWWGPVGFTSTFHSFEFEPGGEWKFTMHSPQGADFPNESRFVELIPGKRVVIEHVCAPYFTLFIDLTPSGNGTRLSWVGRFRTVEECERVRKFAGPANEENLDRLAAELDVRSEPVS